MIVKPIVKYTLTDTEGVVVTAGTETDITNDVGSWQELEIEQKREDTSGVISEVSFPITFHFRAKEIIDALFEARGFYAQAVFKIYQRADYSDEYTLLKSMRLDFSTYSATKDSTELESISDDLAEYISSRKSTSYDINVSEIADTDKKWNYKRMNLIDEGTWTIPTWDGKTEGDKSAYSFECNNREITTITMKSNEVEMTPGGAENIFQTQTIESSLYLSIEPIIHLNTFFFQSWEKGSLNPFTLKFKGKFYAKLQDNKYPNDEHLDNVSIVLLWGSSSNDYTILKEWNPTIDNDIAVWDIDYTTYGDYDIAKVQGHPNFPGLYLNPGEMLAFAVKNLNSIVELTPRYTLFWADQEDGDPTFTMTYVGKATNPIVPLDVIKPETLLQKFIDLMTEQNTNNRTYTSAINWGSLYPSGMLTRICAAESVRQFENAVLHGKFNDFTDWMRTLGYEYGITGNHIEFKPRDAYFQREITALTLDSSDVSELETQAAEDYAYTNVRIGYDKQDYDSINGRAEVNGTFEYTTGYLNREENTLELISPYRADSIGFELLCREVYKSDSTDTDSDNDIFFVALVDNGTDYTTYETRRIVDNKTGVTMFNAPFCPYFLALANKSLIGISTDKLTFASTDMNREASIPPTNIYGNITIDQQLFKPVKYTVSTGNFKDLPSPDVWNGVVVFIVNDVTKSGFISSITKNYSTDSETDWELWAI